MSGITIEGLNPSSIEPSDDGGEIRTYQIGEYLVRVKVTDATPYPWIEFVGSEGESIHMGGFVGWSSHDDGDHIGSPYWALSSAIYGLARIHEDTGGSVRWDDPRGENMMDWDHVIISRFKSLENEKFKTLSPRSPIGTHPSYASSGRYSFVCPDCESVIEFTHEINDYYENNGEIVGYDIPTEDGGVPHCVECSKEYE